MSPSPPLTMPQYRASIFCPRSVPIPSSFCRMQHACEQGHTARQHRLSLPEKPDANGTVASQCVQAHCLRSYHTSAVTEQSACLQDVQVALQAPRQEDEPSRAKPR